MVRGRVQPSAPAGVSVPSQVPGIVLRRPNAIKGADGVADAINAAELAVW
jgi:hypothetical protein